MSESTKNSYPQISTKVWFSLREKFKKTIPTIVTTSYLISAIGGKESSHKGVTIPSLKTLGIIDTECKPTEIAKRWRMDETFSQACKEILNSVYPTELIEAQPPESYERDGIINWFMTHGLGEGAAKTYTTFYICLCDAKLSQNEKSTKTESTRKKVINKTPTVANAQKNLTTQESSLKQDVHISNSLNDNNAFNPLMPNFHIDMHVHIAPELTLEQIEKVFESMAKHLYQNKSN